MNLVNINTLAAISSPQLPSHVVMELVRWDWLDGAQRNQCQRCSQLRSWQETGSCRKYINTWKSHTRKILRYKKINSYVLLNYISDQLSILYIVSIVSMRHSQISQFLPPPPFPFGIHTFVLYVLCLYFCFANRINRIIFLDSTCMW